MLEDQPLSGIGLDLAMLTRPPWITPLPTIKGVPGYRNAPQPACTLV
jgi:hypothetical protein